MNISPANWRKPIRIGLATTAMAALTVALLISPAGAFQDGPLTVDKKNPRVGDTVTFSGDGCVAGAQVEYRVLRGDINAPEIEIVADTEAAADGAFSTSFVVPTGTTPGPLEISAGCGTSDSTSQILAVTVNVIGLAVTGVSALTLGLIGFVAVVAGTALLAVRPRNRRDWQD